MVILVNPNEFKVPYAIGDKDALHQISDGRPKSENLQCPICRTAVSFIRETEGRAAHFRHHSRQECDSLAAYHRETLHDAVRDAAVALLNSGFGAKRICYSSMALPTGQIKSEAPQFAQGRKHVPDIVIMPAPGEVAPILEMEVIYSHKPDSARVSRAAEDGRLIAVIDIAPIERDYYRKLWANEAFDIPEACKAYVLDRRFTVMEDADVRRFVRGMLGRRKYLDADILPQHRPAVRPPALAAKGRPLLPSHPQTCSVCGRSDWRVSVTLEDGKKSHVACAPSTPHWRNPLAAEKSGQVRSEEV